MQQVNVKFYVFNVVARKMYNIKFCFNYLRIFRLCSKECRNLCVVENILAEDSKVTGLTITHVREVT
jgi:hypothetical protein